MIAGALLFCFGAFALLGVFLFINSILVFNSVKYMAIAPSMIWRYSNYALCLPNVLKHLYDAGFASPWPSRPSALSTFLFRRKLQVALEGTFPDARPFIQQHLGLWAFVQLHRIKMQRLLRKRQMQRARAILTDSLDVSIRSRILAFMNQCENESNQARPSAMISIDRQSWFTRMKAMEVLLSEHGYHVSDEFAALNHWETADDEIILVELSTAASKPVNA